MILRKPYAFLIKNFKLLHFLLSVMLCFSIYRVANIITFYNEYLASPTLIKNIDGISNLFPISIFLIAFFAIIISLVILFILFNKKKPYTLYIFVIVYFILLLILFNISHGMIIDMQTVLADIRSIKIIKDIYTLMVLFNAILIVLTIVRATGFDIKKFNFTKDLQELNIAEEDSEEFEVELNVDSNEIRRKARKGLRFFKYYYVENKFIINLSVVIALTIIAFIFYFFIMVHHKNYDQSSTFNTTDFTMHVNNAYLTNKDYMENVITDNYLVIIDMRLKSFKVQGKELELVKCSLSVNGNVYHPINNYRDLLIDLGVVYDGQLIYNENINYLLVFEIPYKDIDNEMTFRYTTDIGVSLRNLVPVYAKVKLKPINLDTKTENKVYNVGDTISLEDSITNGNIVINNFDINKTMVENYRFCYASKTCYDSIEYVKPTLGNYDKTILMVDGKIEGNNITGVYNLYNFIKKFGKIEYEIDGKLKKTSVFGKVSPEHNTENMYYLEVLEELENASKISIKFYIRNKSYEYILK